jgi:LPXTG-motif cell wall-anchored protein
MISGALVASFAGLAWTSPASAATTSLGPINFESGYTAGNINGQGGWSKSGQYDDEVENLSDYPDASGYGFETKALRASNFYADGAFGGQAFSPGLTQAAGEGAASYFTASFEIGTTKAVQQPGLAVSVSPDDGNGGRMSYLRFNDQADGVHVVFVDVTDKGPLGTAATFNPDVPIATLDRATSHAIRFEIAFVDGPGNADGVGNDVVKIFVDDVLKHTGTTWENYYRYDPEQAGNDNALPTTSKLLFAARGEPVVTLLQGQGYLIDDVSLNSSTTAPVVTPPTAEGVPYEGNKTCADLAPAGTTWEEFKIDAIPANGTYDDPKSDLVITISNATSQTFDWASNHLDMAAVLVKGSNGGIQYGYPGNADFSDTGLHALEAKKNYHDISHVNFCFKVGGDTQPSLDEPVTPNPANPNPANPNPANPNPANPQPVAPQLVAPQPVVPQTPAAKAGTEVLGETLVRDDTLPRTGATATQQLALVGGLGLALGLALLMLSYRKTAVESS